jgi:hypothetical protein
LWRFAWIEMKRAADHWDDERVCLWRFAWIEVNRAADHWDEERV